MDRTECGFAGIPEQVRAARGFTHAAMARWGLETTDVVLVVGELAANAVRHANSAFALSLCLLDDTVTIEVTDASPALALMAPTPWNGTSGRGLLIVDKLAKLWGSRPCGAGKTVWAEIQVR